MRRVLRQKQSLLALVEPISGDEIISSVAAGSYAAIYINDSSLPEVVQLGRNPQFGWVFVTQDGITHHIQDFPNNEVRGTVLDDSPWCCPECGNTIQFKAKEIVLDKNLATYHCLNAKYCSLAKNHVTLYLPVDSEILGSTIHTVFMAKKV